MSAAPLETTAVPVAPPSGVALRPAPLETKQLLAIIKSAITRQARTLSPEDRFDLGQDVYLSLQTKPEMATPAGISFMVRTKIINQIKTEKLHREIITNTRELGAHPGYKCSLKRDPTKNYMAVKAGGHGGGLNEYEDAIIGAIDYRRNHGQGPWKNRPRNRK